MNETFYTCHALGNPACSYKAAMFTVSFSFLLARSHKRY